VAVTSGNRGVNAFGIGGSPTLVVFALRISGAAKKTRELARMIGIEARRGGRRGAGGWDWS